MLNNKPLLNKVYTKTNKDAASSHIIFGHSDKTWIMPEESLNMAFDMYQPSTFKGKMLKTLISVFHNNKTVLCKLNCEKAYLEFNKNIKNHIAKIIGTNDFSIAAYMGDTTSRQNNKSTLQIYNKDGLICYAKVTEDLLVSENFQHEIEVLKFLEGKEIDGIPKVLSVDDVDGIKVFLQSTDKKPNEKVKLKFGRPQLEFINNIVEKTTVVSEYVNTDFHKSVEYLKEHLEDYADRQQEILKESIKIIEEKLTEKEKEYAFSHGDYTPWNVYYTGEKLNAFDFEYCTYTMPCHIDIFHYMTQMVMLGQKGDVGAVVHFYRKNRNLLSEYIRDIDFSYLCYLVHITSFYNKRNESRQDIATRQVEKWIGLMEYILIRRAKYNEA